MTRNIITLICVAVASALLLTGLEEITKPVIEQNREEERQEILQEFFPDMGDVEDVEEKEIGEVKYEFVFDHEGEEIGVMIENNAPGYGGDITYYLGIDMEGNVKGIRVVAHEETPGIGDAIEEEGFLEKFSGKSYEDDISEEVDHRTGATISTQGLRDSVDEAVQQFAIDILGVEEEAPIDISQVPDGKYRGEAAGHSGEPIKVEVIVEEGEVLEVEITEFGDGKQAEELAGRLIPRYIIEEQEVEVDAITRATESSEAIIEAVDNALR